MKNKKKKAKKQIIKWCIFSIVYIIFLICLQLNYLIIANILYMPICIFVFYNLIYKPLKNFLED